MSCSQIIIMFDLIHTSNLSDHLGLLNLLVTCSPRLRDDTSILVTETFSWSSHYRTLQEYLNDNLSCDPMLLPLVLGIHLAEDLDLGTSKFKNFPIFKWADIETLYWVKSHEHSNVMINLQESPDVQTFIEQLVVNCCKTNSAKLFEMRKGWKVAIHTINSVLYFAWFAEQDFQVGFRNC